MADAVNNCEKDLTSTRPNHERPKQVTLDMRTKQLRLGSDTGILLGFVEGIGMTAFPNLTTNAKGRYTQDEISAITALGAATP